MSKKIGIPCEFKYELAMKGWSSMIVAFMYVIRDEFDASTALKLLEKLYKRDNRVKNLIKNIKTIFKIEGNDLEALTKWFEVCDELTGIEATWLERSKTSLRNKITKCPFKTGYKDLSDYIFIWMNIVLETINPKITFERPKGMCAGDPYCEYVYKLEE